MLDLDGTSLTQEENKLLLNPHVGGVILFARNIFSRDQVQELCGEIRKINPKLLIAVDQEGGRVQRLKEGYTILPTMQKLSAFLNSDSDKNFSFATDSVISTSPSIKYGMVPRIFTSIYSLCKNLGGNGIISDS